MEIDKIMKRRVRKIWGRAFCQKKPCGGRTLGHKGLAKQHETIKDYKNTSFDTLKLFLAHIRPFATSLIPTANSMELRPAVNERGPLS